MSEIRNRERPIRELHEKFQRLAQIRQNKLSELAPELSTWTDHNFLMFGAGLDVCITSFFETVDIIQSKQKPRKLRIRGTDGHEYQFIAKAHEDLETDHRAMQFFSLMNEFLHTRIPVYSITPLTSALGLIQWLPNTITFHDLVQHYINRVAPTWSKPSNGYSPFLTYFQKEKDGSSSAEWRTTTNLQRLEAYRYVSALPGVRQVQNALRDMMWVAAAESETWITYQMSYSRSTAVMSMVGYVIGLGDRHLSNEMMDKRTGGVVHIDFGDCFEAAQRREQHKEYVPFRLTPLVVRALGPSGCDGIFRRVCEETMITVRQNRESIVTLLRIIITAPAREGNAVGMLARAQSEAEMPAVRKREGMFDRVEAKVSGSDFGPEPGLPVTEQVSRLIRQATDHYNLARGFPGWFPWI